MMRADTRRERDAARRTLLLDLSRNGLRAEKAAREIDIVCPPPLVGGHLNGMRAAHDARKAAQHVDAAEDLGCAVYSRRYLALVAHIDGFGHDAPVGEACVQLLDAFEGGVGVYVPEGEARGAMFEEGFRGFEGESACSAGDWECISPRACWRPGIGCVPSCSRTDGVAVDFEPELCSFCWLEVFWWWSCLGQWALCCR